MKVKYKKYIFFVLVLSALTLSHCAVFALGFGNGRVKNYTPPEDRAGWGYGIEYVDHEVTPVQYMFSDDFGVHDWIADSAIRLILNSENSVYKNKIKSWLFHDDMKLSQFDSSTGAGGSRSKWFQDRSYHNSDEVWYKSRRYITFLHGTGIPDFRGWALKSDPNTKRYSSISIQDKNAPRNERVNTEPRIHSSSHSYVYEWQWLDNNRKELPYGVYVPIEQGAATAASRAGKEAIRLLEFEKKLSNGTTQRIPKYEAAAWCLGAMAHYVGDVANPAHVYKKYQFSNPVVGGKEARSDGDLDYYADTQIGDRFVTSKNPNGASDWSLLNVESLKVQGVVLKNSGTQEITGLTHKIPPYSCVSYMAYLTHTGYDKHNGFDDPQQLSNSAVHPERPYYGHYAAFSLSTLNYKADSAAQMSPSKYVPYWSSDVSAPPYSGYYDIARARTIQRMDCLLEWAVYWTACAILWVSFNADISDDTVSDREVAFDTVKEGIQPRVLMGDEILQEQVDNALLNNDGVIVTRPKGGWRVAASLSLLVPIMALVVIPAAMKKGLELHKTPEDTGPTEDSGGIGGFVGERAEV